LAAVRSAFSRAGFCAPNHSPRQSRLSTSSTNAICQKALSIFGGYGLMNERHHVAHRRPSARTVIYVK
jgi:hypothetical protein